ncbi:MAG: RNA-binding domain-containing protein [Thermoprotei archaeon]
MDRGDVIVTVRVRVYVTEDRDRVIRAVANMVRLPQFEVVEKTELYEVLEGVAYGRECLEPIRRAIRHQKTLDAARSYMIHNMREHSFSFELHKQAAYVGVAVFCSNQSESPLGPISIRIEAENPQAVLDWLATPTVDGVPIDELGKRGLKGKPVRRRDDMLTGDDFF